MHTYAIVPQFVITNPDSTTIAMSEVRATFEDGTTVVFGAETFKIPAPLAPTWYYVTVNRSSRVAACDISGELVGVPGHVYVGAIQAIPTGRSTNVIAGGWPPPTTWLVGD